MSHRNFHDSGFGRGRHNSNYQGSNFRSSFDPYDSRRDDNHASSGNPMFRSQPSSFVESSSMNPPMDSNPQFGGNQSQLELANQILKAVLSSTGSGSVGPSRSRDRSPHYRSRSPDYRSDRSFGRRSPPRQSRSPHRRFDKFESRRGRSFAPRGRPFSSRGRPFAPRGRFDKSRPPYKKFSYDERPRKDFAKKRSLSQDEERKSQERGDSDQSNKRPKLDNEEGIEKKENIEKPEVTIQQKSKFPADALYCHICNHGGFTSEDTYLFHLEGTRHRKTASAFHEKNEVTLQYLRKNAKLAAIRVGRLERSVVPYKCTTCHAVVRESFFSHKRLLEHKLVKKFLMPKCCGRIFKNHHDMDEHRLSLPHLKKVRESNEVKNELMEQVEEGSDKKPDAIILALKSRMNNSFEEVNHIKNIPPFDGNSMIGMDHLKPRPSVVCEPCQMLLPSSVKALEGHLVSLNHYNNFAEFLRSKHKQKMSNKFENKTDSKPEDDAKSPNHEDEDIPESDDDEFMFDESQQIILEEVGEEINDSYDEDGTREIDDHEGTVEQDEPQEDSTEAQNEAEDNEEDDHENEKDPDEDNEEEES